MASEDSPASGSAATGPSGPSPVQGGSHNRVTGGTDVGVPLEPHPAPGVDWGHAHMADPPRVPVRSGQLRVWDTAVSVTSQRGAELGGKTFLVLAPHGRIASDGGDWFNWTLLVEGRVEVFYDSYIEAFSSEVAGDPTAVGCNPTGGVV